MAALGLWMLLTASLVVSSCGGGSLVATNGGVGTGGTGISLGTVTGFGSVVLDGTAYSSATPQYLAGSDRSEAQPAAATAVSLGSQLQMQLDGQGNPSTSLIAPSLIGPAVLSGAGLTINGVAVQVNADAAAGPVTYYSGLSGFASLQGGMPLEVHGAGGIDANGRDYVQATLIAQLPTSNAVTRLSGRITRLDAARQSFQIGSQAIRLAQGASVLPAGVALAEGQWVNVWSNVPLSNGAVTAATVRVQTLLGTSGPAQIGGLVSLPGPSQFQIAGIPVVAGSAALAATFQGLTSGQYVVVQGQVNPASGTVTAASIRLAAAQPTQVELKGAITGYVGPDNFLVRGVRVDASAAAVTFLSGNAAALGNGVFVDIIGSVAAGANSAVTVKSIAATQATPDGGTVDLQGTVSQIGKSSGSFQLTWQQHGVSRSATVTLAANVVYSGGGAAQLVDGAAVEIEATNTASGLLAYSVTLRAGNGPPNPGGSSPELDSKGVVYNMVGSTSFFVNGLQIQINGVAPQGGVLRDGAVVDVDFVPSGKQYLATSISVLR
jgi:hypothetical protein